jgi:small GTP-binding protein
MALPQHHVLVLGARGTGKTSLIYRLLQREFETFAIPTHGPHANRIESDSATFIVWDVPGDNISFATSVHALVFVAAWDMADSLRAISDIFTAVQSQIDLSNIPVSIVMNKDDISARTISRDEFARFQIPRCAGYGRWIVSARNGSNIVPSFDVVFARAAAAAEKGRTHRPLTVPRTPIATPR